MDKIQLIEKLFLYYTLVASFILIPSFYLINYAKKRNKQSFLIALYGFVFCFFVMFALSLNDRFYSTFTIQQKKAIIFFYTYLEYAFFTLILASNIAKTGIKRMMLVFSVLFALFQILYYLLTPLTRIDDISIGIETILIFIYIIAFFYDFFKRSNSDVIYKDAGFWVCLGLLTYLGGTFFFNILANHVINIDHYWFITFIAEIIKNIFFSIAIIIIANQKSKSLTSTKTTTLPYLDIL